MICPYCKKEVELVEETTSQIITIKDKEGRIKTWTEEIRDTDNILLSKRVDEYAYFLKTGSIDTINQKVYDGEGSLRSEKTVKHFEDYKQPEVELTKNIDTEQWFIMADTWQDTATDTWQDTVTDTWEDEVECPEDCANCCYEMLVWIYYLEGECGVEKCSDYNGMYTLLQQGVDGTDCEWLYTDPVDGWTIKIHCEDGYWWLTIQNGDTICAQWKYSMAGYP